MSKNWDEARLLMDRGKVRRLLVGEFSFKRLIRSSGFIYISLMIYAVFWSEQLLFPAPSASYRDDDEIIKEEIIKIETEGGVTLSALHLIHPDAPFTVLYSHGNGVDLGHIQPFLNDYRKRGFSVVSYDYRGYGTSQGKSTEKTAYRDVTAVYNYLVRNAAVPSSRIIVHGRSLGGGPATYLASTHDVAGLILESTFVSAFRVITHIPLFPFDKFNNVAKIDEIDCPLLVIHGVEDRIVPFWHSEVLFSKALEPKRRFWVAQATHNDVPWIAQDRYWATIHEFTQSVNAL